MKILQVNAVYKKGSTGKLTYDLHNQLKKRGVSSVVCYGRGEKFIEEDIFKTCFELTSYLNHFISFFTGIIYGGNYLATFKLFSIIRKQKPDIVHLQCINGYFVNIYLLLRWLKRKQIRTVVTLHAEFMYTGGCGHSLDCEKWTNQPLACGNCPYIGKEIKSYFFDRTRAMWSKMNFSFKGFNDNLIITSVSPWLKSRAEVSPILKNKKHKVVMNGVDTEEVFYPHPFSDLKINHGIGNEKVILHVTPIFSLEKNHIKGGLYVIEVAKRLKNDSVKIIVAGDYDNNLSYPDNMIMLGRITDQNLLAKYYSLANLTLLTSKKETFSMVTAESMCCGTPVVGFQAGAPEQIALKDFSEFVEYANINHLIIAIKKMIHNNYDSKKIAEYAQCYSSKNMVKNYIEVYQDLLNS